jgi:hypothetical protein
MSDNWRADQLWLLQAGTVVMGTSFPTPYEAVVDKTKGLSVRRLAQLALYSRHLHAQGVRPHLCCHAFLLALRFEE